MAENDTETKENKIWKANREKPIEPELIDEIDFEDSRRCLLNSYHSYVQTHAGYIIALIIGFIAIIATFESFIKSNVGTFAFIFLIIAIVGTSAFFTLRIFYWTLMVNVAISIPIDTALGYFNDANKTYSCKAPNTVIIEVAIDKQLKLDIQAGSMPWYKRWAYKIARISFERLLKRLKVILSYLY
jgi:hypothetical protein